MAEKEIQVVNFMKQNNSYVDYQNVDIRELEQKLENENLTPMERRRLEAIHKNCLLLQKDSFSEKTNFLAEETKSEQRRQRIEEMKKEKERVLHARKIVVRAGIIALLAAGSIGGIKLYHDTQVKPIQMINENYDKIYSTITVEKGQTLTDIAKKIYESYPEEVKEVKTVNDVIDEIARSNHIQNYDEIRSGQILVIPSEYVDKEDEIDTVKSMQ